ncbi:MAG: 6-carboxytetrahydropterin synthase [Candidatus Zixiibacteriota bacterium]
MDVQIEVTRKARFCAGHRYWRPDWTAEQNRATFGACAGEHGHGHNYVLEVTVSGSVDPITGMLLNLRDMDRLITKLLIDRLDHRNLNHDVPELAGRVPTTEVLAEFAWNTLVDRLPVGRLERVRIYESDDLWAECRRTP